MRLQGYADDYEYIESQSKWNRMRFGETMMYAFGMELDGLVLKHHGKLEHYSNRSPMKDFCLEILESGEYICELSLKYGKINNRT